MAVEVVLGFLYVFLVVIDFDVLRRVTLQAHEEPFDMIAADAATQFAKESQFVGQNDLLIIGKGIGQHHLHAVAAINERITASVRCRISKRSSLLPTRSSACRNNWRCFQSR